MEFKAHIFDSEIEALEAIELINKGEGIPKNENAVTRTYTTAMKYEDIYYIYADDVTEKYLGKSKILKIETDERTI